MAKYRYLPIGSQPIYDNEYNLRMVQSNILNSGNQNFGAYSSLWDKKTTVFEILRVGGDENGQYYRGTELTLAEIPNTERKLEILDNKFKNYQSDRSNQGYAVTEVWPIELLNEKLKTQAKLDVLQLELTQLKKHLSAFIEIENIESDKNILLYGLQGNGKLRNGYLSELDGQKIISQDGLMIIANGIYKGMAVTDYRILCLEWQEGREQAEKEQLRQMQDLAKAEGRSIPRELPVRSPRQVAKASLPAYPSHFKNYLSES
jgi:hypothetical protein